jgi:outer membrane protein assembly factor BamB
MPRRRHVRSAVISAVVAAVVAGCGEARVQTTTRALEPPRRPQPAQHEARHAIAAITVLDGDTRRRVAGAVVTVRGGKRRSQTLFAVRHRRPLVRVTAWAPRYATRTQWVPLARRVTIRLYRPDGQWPMYGAGPARTQASHGIRLRPPFRIVWGKHLGGLVELPAVVSDGVAFVSNYYGTVYALEMANGRTRWRFDLGSSREASSPAVADTWVVAHSRNGMVYVLDRWNGRKRWSWRARGELESSPVVLGGVDYFGDSAGHLYALDLTRRRVRWVYHDGCKITSSVAVAGGSIYFGDYCGRLVSLSRRDGRLRFAVSAGSPVYGTVAVAHGRVFVPSRDAGSLVAFTTSGRYLWSVSTGGYVYSSPAVWGGRVFVGSYTGALYCVSATSGRVLWTVFAGGAISGAPVVVDGIVYAGSFAHRIVGVDVRSGRVVFTFPHGEYVPVSGNRGRLLLHGFSRVWAVEPVKPGPGVRR